MLGKYECGQNPPTHLQFDTCKVVSCSSFGWAEAWFLLGPAWLTGEGRGPVLSGPRYKVFTLNSFGHGGTIRISLRWEISQRVFSLRIH